MCVDGVVLCCVVLCCVVLRPRPSSAPEILSTTLESELLLGEYK